MSRTTNEPVEKVLLWPHFFFLVELPICMEESILGLDCLTVQLAISIIPKMNRTVFNSLKLGVTIFLCHMMFTKAFDFNMQLFCQCKHFLTYIFFLIASSAGEEMLPWQSISCSNLFMVLIVYFSKAISLQINFQ